MAKPDPDVVAALERVTELDKSVIKDMASLGNRVNIPDHWSVLFEKTSADMAYVILDGEVEVRKDGATIATMGPGSIFGEMALLDNTLRSASIVTATPISALRLDADSLAELTKKHPDFADELRAVANKHRGD